VGRVTVLIADVTRVEVPEVEAKHLFFVSASGTFETCRWPLTKSVIEGKADFPIARPDFAV
jgi:hypothetical protein